MKPCDSVVPRGTESINHHHCHPLIRPHQRSSQNTIVPVDIVLAIAILLFILINVAHKTPPSLLPLPLPSSTSCLLAAGLIRRALSLIVVARRRAHVHRPHLPLPSQVDCCLFTPLIVGGGLGASSAPPIQRTCPTPPRRCSKNESPGVELRLAHFLLDFRVCR